MQPHYLDGPATCVTDVKEYLVDLETDVTAASSAMVEILSDATRIDGLSTTTTAKSLTADEVLAMAKGGKTLHDVVFGKNGFSHYFLLITSLISHYVFGDFGLPRGEAAVEEMVQQINCSGDPEVFNGHNDFEGKRFSKCEVIDRRVEKYCPSDKKKEVSGEVGSGDFEEGSGG